MPGWCFDIKVVFQADLAAECSGKEKLRVQEAVKMTSGVSPWEGLGWDEMERMGWE